MLPPDPALSIFSWQGIDIFQKEGVFKIGTDALLLATWVSRIAHDPKQILDIGCGSGVLSILLASQFQKARISAVDIQQEAVELTIHNTRHTGLTDRIGVRQCDILGMDILELEGHDLVVSNPPFFFNQLEPYRSDRLISKHTAITPGRWINAMLRHAAPGGIICVVIPSGVAFEWTRAANESGWHCQQRVDVYSFRGDVTPRRSLLQFGMELCKIQLEDLHIYEEGTQQTHAYQAWLHSAPGTNEKR